VTVSAAPRPESAVHVRERLEDVELEHEAVEAGVEQRRVPRNFVMAVPTTRLRRSSGRSERVP
jgi:hypothetical protein